MSEKKLLKVFHCNVKVGFFVHCFAVHFEQVSRDLQDKVSLCKRVEEVFVAVCQPCIARDVEDLDAQ